MAFNDKLLNFLDTNQKTMKDFVEEEFDLPKVLLSFPFKNYNAYQNPELASARELWEGNVDDSRSLTVEGDLLVAGFFGMVVGVCLGTLGAIGSLFKFLTTLFFSPYLIAKNGFMPTMTLLAKHAISTAVSVFNATIAGPLNIAGILLVKIPIRGIVSAVEAIKDAIANKKDANSPFEQQPQDDNLQQDVTVENKDALDSVVLESTSDNTDDKSLDNKEEIKEEVKEEVCDEKSHEHDVASNNDTATEATLTVDESSKVNQGSQPVVPLEQPQVEHTATP